MYFTTQALLNITTPCSRLYFFKQPSTRSGYLIHTLALTLANSIAATDS